MDEDIKQGEIMRSTQELTITITVRVPPSLREFLENYKQSRFGKVCRVHPLIDGDLDEGAIEIPTQLGRSRTSHVAGSKS